MVRDLEGKSRGYGFIACKRSKDFLSAYKQADGKKIDGRTIVADAEMGRIKEKWRPKRLGGGRGRSRRSVKHPYRERVAGEVERSRSRSRDRRRRSRNESTGGRRGGFGR